MTRAPSPNLPTAWLKYLMHPSSLLPTHLRLPLPEFDIVFAFPSSAPKILQLVPPCSQIFSIGDLFWKLNSILETFFNKKKTMLALILLLDPSLTLTMPVPHSHSLYLLLRALSQRDVGKATEGFIRY